MRFANFSGKNDLRKSADVLQASGVCGVDLLSANSPALVTEVRSAKSEADRFTVWKDAYC